MKNKNIYMSKITKLSLVSIILLILIFKNQAMISKIIMTPFLLCSLFLLGKNICLMLKKKNLATIFNKLFVLAFLIFWFEILIYGNYIFIINKNYFSIICLIPFWLGGYYIAKKNFVKKTHQYTFAFPISVSTILVASVLIIGINCLYFGIYNTYKLNRRTKDYLEIDSYLIDYEVYSKSNKDGTTYRLIYKYKVNETEYEIKTDYGVGYIPERNSIRKVKYNPLDPSKAVLEGTNQNRFLIYFGTFFTLVGMTFVIGSLYIKGVFDKVKVNVMEIYLSIVCTIIGIGIIIIQNGTTFSLIEMIKTMKIFIIVPVVFLVMGINLIIKNIFIKNTSHNKK